jgi:hypothetical protein
MSHHVVAPADRPAYRRVAVDHPHIVDDLPAGTARFAA